MRKMTQYHVDFCRNRGANGKFNKKEVFVIISATFDDDTYESTDLSFPTDTLHVVAPLLLQQLALGQTPNQLHDAILKLGAM